MARAALEVLERHRSGLLQEADVLARDPAVPRRHAGGAVLLDHHDLARGRDPRAVPVVPEVVAVHVAVGEPERRVVRVVRGLAAAPLFHGEGAGDLDAAGAEDGPEEGHAVSLAVVEGGEGPRRGGDLDLALAEREREGEEGGEGVGGLHGVEAIGVWRARR